MTTNNDSVAAHTQTEEHHYIMHYPEHPARKDDPHYVDFNEYHKTHRQAAKCWIGEHIGFEDCRDAQFNPAPPDESGYQPGLELHHSYVEFSLQNGIDLKALEKDFPGISDTTQVGAWVESDTNFRWLCAWHHRGAAGAHTASHSDWTASAYVHGLITKD
jgi:hypothetical protein